MSYLQRLYSGFSRHPFTRFLYNSAVEGPTGPFTPAQLPGLKGWWDASDTATITLNAGDVSAWNDKSGNGNHLVQATGTLQPLFLASGINSLGSVQFYDDGTAKVLAAPDAASMDHTTIDLFVAFRWNTDLAATESIAGKFSTGTPANQREFILTIASGNAGNPMQGVLSGDGTATTALLTPTGLSTATSYIAEMWNDGTNGYVRINNAPASEARAAFAAIFNGTAPFFAGARDTATNPSAVTIGEIIYCSPALSASSTALTLDYLSTKWNIALFPGFVNPASLPGLAVWYDVSDITSLFQDSAGTVPVTANGDPIGRLTDKSGNGNHGTQTTAASCPTYTTASAPNGLATALLDGSNDRIAVPNIGLTGTAAATIIIICRMNSTSSGADAVVSFGASSEGQFQSSGANDDNLVTAGSLGWRGDGNIISPGQAVNAFMAFILRTNGTTVQSWRNTAASTVFSDTQLGNWTTGAGAYGIGATNTPDRFAGLNLCEFAIYNTVKTNAEIELLMPYFVNKWGIT